jgi:hypothetical protein
MNSFPVIADDAFDCPDDAFDCLPELSAFKCIHVSDSLLSTPTRTPLTPLKDKSTNPAYLVSATFPSPLPFVGSTFPSPLPFVGSTFPSPLPFVGSTSPSPLPFVGSSAFSHTVYPGFLGFSPFSRTSSPDPMTPSPRHLSPVATVGTPMFLNRPVAIRPVATLPHMVTTRPVAIRVKKKLAFRAETKLLFNITNSIVTSSVVTASAAHPIDDMLLQRQQNSVFRYVFKNQSDSTVQGARSFSFDDLVDSGPNVSGKQTICIHS